MEFAVEYEFGKYLECEGEGVTYILGGDTNIKWKLYRGLKRFSTGKMLSEIEEHVYGDDGIVIRVEGKKVKAKDINLLLLDNRESFFEDLRLSRGSMLNQFIDTLQEEFDITKKIDVLNDEILKLEIVFQERFSDLFTTIRPILKQFTFADLLKNSLGLSYYEAENEYPLEMMDVATVIDDYCDILQYNLKRMQKETWMWIMNPNAFIDNNAFSYFINRLKQICSETNLLRVFILSDECLSICHCEEDIANTVLVFQNEQQQLPEFDDLISSIERYYPDHLNYERPELLKSLYRIFPYVGYQKHEDIYLKPRDMVLLKVVSQLLDVPCREKRLDFNAELTNLELKYLQNE